MYRDWIAFKVRQAETKEDLLELLNQVKQMQMCKSGLEDMFHPFTIKHLNYYCNPNNVFHRYVQFKIKKKSGGFRLITKPKNPGFMMILQCMNEIFKSLYTPSNYAMGFSEGRCVVSNADIHKGQNYIFNTDLKDFFTSIEQARVWKRLQLAPICFKQPIASVIAGLCSMKQKTEDGSVKFVLPQGSPTSPILTNMVCDTLDRRLAGLARRFGLRYSRYADDITFSSMHNVYQEGSEFRKELTRIIESQGFTLNSEKTRLQRRGARQEVTGIIVSHKLNVTQSYVRDIRNALYIWDRYGYDTASVRFFHKYKKEKGCTKKGETNMGNVLHGKLMYLKMVKGEKDPVFLRLKAKFDSLSQTLRSQDTTNPRGITFVETTPIIEFEKKNNTTVIISKSKPWTEFYCDVAPGQLIPHRYGYFKLSGKLRKASVNRTLTMEEETQKDILSISHCRDAKGKAFWLIHRSDKVFGKSVSKAVDIDELNSELDNLLS